VPIRPAPKRPVYLSVLRAKPGASTIPLGEASPHLLAVERRVGRGRITMLTINPNDPALLSWPGLDTLVRRVILRRPEEPIAGPGGFDGYRPQPPRRGRLLAQDLSWYRITSRDTRSDGELSNPPGANRSPGPGGPDRASEDADPAEDERNSLAGVAAWRDDARLPRLSRNLLEQASGITIPSKHFILKVILAYLLAVVPLNWLICRYIFNRREWAWVVVPLVALGFAIGVERVAAHDLGYDTASDEIDLLELHGEYSRGHVTRFVSLYTTGRTRFAISYPADATALALPLDNGRSIRGEEISTSYWQSSPPVPALSDFSVQPRSMSLFRAEQMAVLSGAIRLEVDQEHRRLKNDSDLELRDAVLIDFGGLNERRERFLGTISGRSAVEIEEKNQSPPQSVQAGPGPDPNAFLQELRRTWEPREENKGELRLVAWVPGTVGGQVIEPAVDRRRGFTAVLVHLRSGSPPSPDGRRYNLMADDNGGLDARMTEEMRTMIRSGPPISRRPMRRMAPRMLPAPSGAQPGRARTR
jgi:hypothetical protein